MSPTERLIRGFKRAGVSNIIDESDLANHCGPVIFVRGDAVLDEPLIAHIVNSENLMIMGDGPKGALPIVAIATEAQGQNAAEAIKNESQKTSKGIKASTI